MFITTGGGGATAASTPDQSPSIQNDWTSSKKGEGKRGTDDTVFVPGKKGM